MSDFKPRKKSRVKEIPTDDIIKGKKNNILFTDNFKIGNEKNLNKDGDKETDKINRTQNLLRHFRDETPSHHIAKQNKENSLRQTIDKLKEKIENEDKSISKIKYPRILLDSLEELDDMIGMKNLKDDISLQVIRLIGALNSGERSVGMLNSIIYGPPGVGKTKIGIILAKILFSLGYFEERRNIESDWTDAINGIPPETLQMIIFISIIVLSYIWSTTKNVYRAGGAKWTMAFMVMLIIILVIVWWYWSEQIKGLADKKSIINENSNKKTEYSDRKIITVVSRSDFVAEYVGQTAVKTKRLLNSNLGKVVMIDEAYSLLADDRDPFGMEALTAINLFMSENENKIAIIFVGYKDLMQRGIFKKQPGLPRRCMWHFECDDYNGKQLGEIFLYQLKEKGWQIEDKNKIISLIEKNGDKFPSYGGDTERLISFSQMAASQNNFYSHSSLSFREGGNTAINEVRNGNRHQILKYSDVEKGLELLIENNIHKNENTNSDNISEMDFLRNYLNRPN